MNFSDFGYKMTENSNWELSYRQRLVVNTPTLLIDLVCKPPFLFSPVETTLLLTSEGTHPPDPRGSSGISPKSGDGVDKTREIEISLISDIIFCKFR